MSLSLNIVSGLCVWERTVSALQVHKLSYPFRTHHKYSEYRTVLRSQSVCLSSLTIPGGVWERLVSALQVHILGTRTVHFIGTASAVPCFSGISPCVFR